MQRGHPPTLPSPPITLHLQMECDAQQKFLLSEVRAALWTVKSEVEALATEWLQRADALSEALSPGGLTLQLQPTNGGKLPPEPKTHFAPCTTTPITSTMQRRATRLPVVVGPAQLYLEIPCAPPEPPKCRAKPKTLSARRPRAPPPPPPPPPAAPPPLPPPHEAPLPMAETNKAGLEVKKSETHCRHCSAGGLMRPGMALAPNRMVSVKVQATTATSTMAVSTEESNLQEHNGLLHARRGVYSARTERSPGGLQNMETETASPENDDAASDASALHPFSPICPEGTTGLDIQHNRPYHNSLHFYQNSRPKANFGVQVELRGKVNPERRRQRNGLEEKGMQTEQAAPQSIFIAIPEGSVEAPRVNSSKSIHQSVPMLRVDMNDPRERQIVSSSTLEQQHSALFPVCEPIKRRCRAASCQTEESRMWQLKAHFNHAKFSQFCREILRATGKVSQVQGLMQQATFIQQQHAADTFASVVARVRLKKLCTGFEQILFINQNLPESRAVPPPGSDSGVHLHSYSVMAHQDQKGWHIAESNRLKLKVMRELFGIEDQHLKELDASRQGNIEDYGALKRAAETMLTTDSYTKLPMLQRGKVVKPCEVAVPIAVSRVSGLLRGLDEMRR